MQERRLSLLQAVSLNMSLMVGIGPFITIPTLVGAMGGPQAMIGWILGACLALADGMVWSELTARFPGSGGTYHFFDAAYGDSLTGRLLKFLFIWQFVFSGPLEIASGAIGLAQYVGFFVPVLSKPVWSWHIPWLAIDSPVPLSQLIGVGVMALTTVIAYRRIDAIGRLMVILWAGMLITVSWVIFASLTHFDPTLAFDFPADAWRLDQRFVTGLGAALAIAMYDFFGYYQICYLSDEVRDASRAIPRAILISVVAVALIYLTMNLGILGVLPYREVIASKAVASDFMLRVSGPTAASIMTVFVIWTAFASVFAAVIGYSRIPYAAARAGDFFSYFAGMHPTAEFPHRSLLLVSGLAMLACLADLGTVILTLVASRILIQFAGQIVTLFYLRSVKQVPSAGFRMPFYPLPAVVALAGWLFVLGTSDTRVLTYAFGTLAMGLLAFVVWDRRTRSRRGPNTDRPEDGSLASRPRGE